MAGMVEKKGWGLWLTHLGLIGGIVIICYPLYIALIASTLTQADLVTPPMPMLPGPHFLDNYREALFTGMSAPVWKMMLNSLVMALGITVGKIAISLISAYAIVYFRFPLRSFFFWLIFLTLMLPVEVRIVPTYEVVAGMKLLNSYSGLILPLVASATATFLFRQLFMTIPDELVEANIAALFVILFIYGWNQYLWPLLITTEPGMNTIVMGIKQMLPTGDQTVEWPVIMATAILAMIPPVAVVIGMRNLFIKGLIESEK
jgi:sn-glycerol 3-phosphate transport system permease protein